MEKPPSDPGSEPDPLFDHLRELLETMQGITLGGAAQAEAPAAETVEPASSRAESLRYICRIAGASAKDSRVSVPLDDMHHLARAGVRLENLFGAPYLTVTDPGAYAAAPGDAAS